MLTTRACALVLLWGVAAIPMLMAQLTDGAAVPQRPAYYGYNEIHIDQDCRILPDPAQAPPGKKLRPHRNEAVCHLESQLDSQHLEERVSGNQLLRNWVSIREHEFVLQNISDQPVTFVVEQLVPENWTVDSDPQPKQFIGNTAYFPVQVRPGEIIRLHVGLRHSTPMRAKAISIH